MLGSPRLWLAFTALAPIALGVGRLLPAEGLGLALRLAGAAACVFILPGAFAVRAVGRPESLGVALAAAVAWSLVGVFLALAVTFAVNGTLGLTLGLFFGLVLALFALSIGKVASPVQRADALAVLALVAGGAALASVLWWATGTIGGSLGPTVSDALFHLARVRKLDDGGALTSIRMPNDLEGGAVNPGYAFPLWHGALALVSRLAGVDPALVVLYLPAILTPIALVVVYGAGTALFRSTWGGIATTLGALALVVFPRNGVGWLQFLSQPGGAARLMLVPGLLALVFAFVAKGDRALLASTAAAAFVLAVVHPTYAAFAALPLAGFLLARVLLSDALETRRLVAGLGAVVVPAALFFAWLAQFVGDTAAQRHAVRFTQQVETLSSGLQVRPEQIAWGGGVKIAALLAVPLAVFAAGRRWAAYVLGGTVAIALTALVPQIFERFADAVSLSQAVRLASFLPLPFALAGAALLAGRWRAFGVAAALGAGIAAELTYDHPATGAAWAVWLSFLGAACGLVLIAAFQKRLNYGGPSAWGAAAMAAFTLPVAVSGPGHLERWDEPDPFGLSPGLTVALRDEVPPLAVVLAPGSTSYRIAGYAPVRVVTEPPGHVAFNTSEDYAKRQRAVRLFFLDPAATPAQREQILARYGVQWVVVDKTRGRPALPPGLVPEYRDSRYELYRIGT
ncbi:MAG TPA: DUF6541 family protein [Gaiellaceae bacterium]